MEENLRVRVYLYRDVFNVLMMGYGVVVASRILIAVLFIRVTAC